MLAFLDSIPKIEANIIFTKLYTGDRKTLMMVNDLMHLKFPIGTKNTFLKKLGQCIIAHARKTP